MRRSAFLVGEGVDGSSELAVLDIFRSDFLKSFQYSQGDPGFQKALLYRVLNYYTNKAGGTLDIDMTLFDEIVRDFHMPGAHVAKLSTDDSGMVVRRKHTPEEAARQLKADLSDFRSIVTGDIYAAGRFDIPISEVCDETIRRDLYYQTEERAYRAQNDLHASYYREYILRGRDTGSEAFDAIFVSAADYLRDNESSELPFAHRLSNLIFEWNANHPGISFYPETPRAPLERLVTV